MRPVGGLVLNRRVPPRVVVNHGVSLRQIQAHAAGLQADQKQRHLARSKTFNQLVALLRLAGKLDPTDLVQGELLLDQSQHAGELREQQHPPAGGQHLGQQLHQQLQLGRLLDLFRGRQGHQARVAADLAQLEQGVQNLDLRLGQALVGKRLAHRFFGRQANRFVQVGLFVAQFHAGDGLLFFRQVGCHLALGAAQHEGGDAAAQLVQPFAVAMFLDRCAKAFLETRLRAQEARHQEVEQAPQFTQVVFHRRARQAQAVARVQLACDARGMGVGVLDVLRLVQHHQVPGLLQPALAITLQQRIRRDHQIMAGHVGGGLVPVLAMQHQGTEFGREAAGLAPPVAHHADWGDHEHRPVQPAGLLFHQDVGQGLQRLAQSHVVGQDAIEPVCAQKLQPLQALLLVRPQVGQQAGWWRKFRQGGAAGELPHHMAQAVGPAPARTFAERRADTQRLQPRQAQAVAVE